MMTDYSLRSSHWVPHRHFMAQNLDWDSFGLLKGGLSCWSPLQQQSRPRSPTVSTPGYGPHDIRGAVHHTQAELQYAAFWLRLWPEPANPARAIQFHHPSAHTDCFLATVLRHLLGPRPAFLSVQVTHSYPGIHKLCLFPIRPGRSSTWLVAAGHDVAQLPPFLIRCASTDPAALCLLFNFVDNVHGRGRPLTPVRPVAFNTPLGQPCLRQIELRTAAPRSIPQHLDEDELPATSTSMRAVMCLLSMARALLRRSGNRSLGSLAMQTAPPACLQPL